MIWLDLETFCPIDLKKAGVYRYAEEVEVTIFAYAFDNGPVKVWDRTATREMPGDLAMGLEDPTELLTGHNSNFDRTVMRLGDMKLDIPIERWRCTMARAMAHSLPGGLDKLCEILNLPVDERKTRIDRQLMMLFCKPRKDKPRATRATHPKEWEQFCEYAGQDVTAMRAIAAKLPAWNYMGRELALWHLDQKINDRGIAVDADLVRAAISTVGGQKRRLNEETRVATDGSVTSANQRDRLLEYILLEHGVELPDMTASTLERRANDPELPSAVRELINIRLQSATASTSKYQSLANMIGADGRLRGTLQFCGAMRTGRWAGRGFQPQNLLRPNLPKETIDEGIILIKDGLADLVVDNVMELAGNCVRGTLIASPGKKLVVSDLANIEGRDQAWLAGEQWKLQAFREFDAGTGPDLYKLAYAKSFGIEPASVDKDQRQIGKVEELSMGYQGGVGAFVTMAATYGMDLEKLSRDALPALPAWVLGEAEDEWLWAVGAKRTLGLPQDLYVPFSALKRLWRTAHPAIVSYWADLEAAARDAALQAGVDVPCRRVTFRREANWLKCLLPSGRVLGYPGVRVDEQGKLSYLGIDTYTKRWSRIKTYGGKFFEQQCQGLARDVMAHNMPPIEDAGYETLLTVHDELITETEGGTEAELSALLSACPPWAEGMPLAASGFETQRYYKG